VTPLGRALRGAGLFAAALVAGLAADATLVEPFRMTSSVIVLPEGPLAAALGGARIVHLSDLHLRGFGPRERRLAAALKEHDPALVLMTGDFADTPEGIEALERLLYQVRPAQGIIAVPGNNDYFRGLQDRIFAALRSSGATLLFNDAIVLRGNGGPFAVAGVDDPFFGRDRVPAALSKSPPGVPLILIAHSPAVLEDRSEAMLFNAGGPEGPWGEGWFWASGSHFRGPNPPIRFESAGRHRIRIQRREDGAGLMTVRFVPRSAAAGEMPHTMERSEAPPDGSGDIVIDVCASMLHVSGSWRRARTSEGRCYLEDAPDRGALAPYPVPDPAGRADLEFDAPAGVAYQVWVRLHSPTSTGRSDSLYLQFGDALGPEGEPQFRIGSEVRAASSPDLALVLAGHTHGGQVRLPWVGPLERTIARGRYVMGRYDNGPAMVYISRGIGTSYLPVRLGCAPEVVVLEPPRSEPRT